MGAVEEAARSGGARALWAPLKEDRRMPGPEAQAQEDGAGSKRAHEELDVAEHLVAGPDVRPRVACFHAQQAAEKALKAALMHDAIRFPSSSLASS